MVPDGKRAYPRYAIDADIEVRIAGHTARGRTTNVSRGGLCVELDLTLEVGLVVEVGITLVFDDKGQSEPLTVPARVMWSTQLGDRFQIGCNFGVLRPRDATFLEMFLRYLDSAASAGDGDAPVNDDPFA